MKLKQLLIASSVSVLMASTSLQAAPGKDDGHSHGHADHGQAKAAEMNHGAMNHDSMGHGASKMFLEKRDIDGYTVSFHVMEANEGMQHGGSHNLMVKVEQGANVIGDLKANSKVIYPDGADESKPLMKMGDWFMAGYDLKPGGKHQLMVLFMTPDGKKHFGGVYYGE